MATLSCDAIACPRPTIHLWLLVALLPLTLLAACVDETAELGRPPPVALATARQTLVLRLRGDPRLQPGEPERLRQAADVLAPGDHQPIRAHIIAFDRGDSDAAWRALVALGIEPARITTSWSSATAPLRPTLELSRTIARTEDCEQAVTPGWHGDPSPSLTSLGRCAQDNNLANMLVDPADLIAPPALSAADGPSAVGAVARWRNAAGSQVSDPSSNGTPADGPTAGQSAGSGALATPAVQGGAPTTPQTNRAMGAP